MGQSDGKLVPDSLYFYAPSHVAPAIFAGLFFFTGAFHLWQCIRYKAFRVTALHPQCCALFVAGFALREYGSYHISNYGIYVASLLCIYCAPPLLELANYHVLGRILYYVPYFAPLHPGRTFTTFGFLSAIVEILNALGVSYLSNAKLPRKTQDLGHVLMKTSLICQLIVMTIFVGITATFHHRCRRAGITSEKVQRPIITICISTGLILSRTIYRTVEHFGFDGIPANPGPDWDPQSLSPIIRYEWFFWVFEATIMYWNSVLWNYWHPRRYLPQDYRIYLAQDGQTELRGPGWKDDQNWVMTFLDPCGLTAALRQKQQKSGRSGKPAKPFWEENGYEHMLSSRGARTAEEASV